MYNREELHSTLTLEEIISHGKEIQDDNGQPSYNVDGRDVYIIVGNNNNINSFNGTNRKSEVGSSVSYDYDTSDMTACEQCAIGMSYENCSSCIHWEDSMIYHEEQRIINHERSIERRNALLSALWSTAKWTVLLPFTLIAREAHIRAAADNSNGSPLIADRTEYIDVDVIEDTTPQLSYKEIENQKALYKSAMEETNYTKSKSRISVYDLINQ